MPTRPHDFRDHFRRVIERSITNTGNSLRFFRETHDFDEFMAKDSPLCSNAPELALAFMVRYFSVYLHSNLRDALFLAVVQYLAERSGRRVVDSSDVEAIRALQSIECKTEKELANWLDAYFRDAR